MSRLLITSALPYINGVKHLGNLVGSMLPADVFGRFARQRGVDVLLLCATDEHGTPAELAAQDAGLDVGTYCQEQHALQKEIGERFNLSWDHFGRSSSPQNAELTRHLADRLTEQGLIEERETEQIYSPVDNRFLPDRYIIGTCPECGYQNARGDQCENCTKLLEPTELIHPRSALSGSTDLELRTTRHLYLLQSQLADRLRDWIDSHDEWPLLVSSIAYKWLDEGLRDRCITRDLSWGVSVDRSGYEDKVFYVWFDAPIAYIGATKEWSDQAPEERDWKSWWYDAEDVRYVEFMAKDNVPFHTLGFPATLIGSGEPWNLVDYVKGFNWLTYYGGKFSTSQKRGVFMDQALELLPADYWRYYLLANAPESGDSSFTWEAFQATVNKDLAGVFGNFVNRTLRFCATRFGTVVPAGGEAGELENELVAKVEIALANFDKQLEAMEFRKAMQQLRALWVLGNDYFQRAEPWAVIQEDEERAATIIRTAVNLVHLFAVVSWPVIPATSERILEALGKPQSPVVRRLVGASAGELLAQLEPGQGFEVPDILFRQISDEEVEEWVLRFGGASEG